MNSITPHYKLARLLVLPVIFLFMFQSCSRKIAFEKSSVVPSAEGKVIIKRDDNKNYAIEVNVTNLADPERLTPKRNAYVVWLQTDDNNTRNMGQMKSSSGLFSSTMKGTLKSVSVAKPTKVYITAEDSPDAGNPGYHIVLTTRNF